MQMLGVSVRGVMRKQMPNGDPLSDRCGSENAHAQPPMTRCIHEARVRTCELR